MVTAIYKDNHKKIKTKQKYLNRIAELESEIEHLKIDILKKDYTQRFLKRICKETK